MAVIEQAGPSAPILSDASLEHLLDNFGEENPHHVLFIGDFASTQLSLSPVVHTISHDYGVEAVTGMTFRHAMEEPNSVNQFSQRAHVLGHGAASVAIKHAQPENMRSLMLIGGTEPQRLSTFFAGFHRLFNAGSNNTQSDSVGESDLLQNLHRIEDILSNPLFYMTIIRAITRTSSLAVASRVAHYQQIPTRYVALEHDEYGTHPPLEIVRRAIRHGVNMATITGPDATHDFLIRNPLMALARAQFRDHLDSS